MKPKFGVARIGIRHGKREGGKFSDGRTDPPITIAPIDYAGRIFSEQRRPCQEVRIVKRDEGRWG